jgi:hypothetical protein
MNWIKLPIVSGAEAAVAEKEMAAKSTANTTVVNLDFYVAIKPLNGGEQSVLVGQDGRELNVDIPFETLCSQIKPILTTTDISGNEI